MVPGFLVGVKGFEPPAPCSQSTCATRLRYTPKVFPGATLAATNVIIHNQHPFVNSFFEIFFTFFQQAFGDGIIGHFDNIKDKNDAFLLSFFTAFRYNNIEENLIVYARYFDGEKGVKQITIVIDTVDNVAPNAFEYTTIVTSNSITVDAYTEDTAADGNGVVSREGVEGIFKYLYKLGDIAYVEESIVLTMKAIFYFSLGIKCFDDA